MREFRCLNWHSHPQPTRGCCEGCMMCCGYTTPAVVGLLIAGLAITSDVYSIILIARNPHSAWRVIVCLIVFILTTALAAAVSWSYYQVIFTPPGFVPRETWQHPPRYVGPPLPPRDTNNGGVQVHFSGNGAAAASQPMAPSMARRSPTHTGDAVQVPPPSFSSSNPSPQPNPLEEKGETDEARTVECDVASAAVVCTDDAEGERRQQCAAGEEGVLHQPSVRVNTGNRSPYASPTGPHGATPAPTRPSSASPLNPYEVRTLGPGGSLRYCRTCRIYKPDSAHHCRLCERCVFNFDHHCPFINNCVGRNNYKLFVLFLLYAGVGATAAGGLMAVTLFAVDGDDIMSKIGWVAVPAVDVVLGLALFLFYVQHRVLLCNGESTLDSIARGDDTFRDWRQSWSRPRRTAAERAELQRQKAAKVEQHYRTLFGHESPWWRRYVPLPVRTDDDADDTVPASV